MYLFIIYDSWVIRGGFRTATAPHGSPLSGCGGGGGDRLPRDFRRTDGSVACLPRDINTLRAGEIVKKSLGPFDKLTI